MTLESLYVILYTASTSEIDSLEHDLWSYNSAQVVAKLHHTCPKEASVCKLWSGLMIMRKIT